DSPASARNVSSASAREGPPIAAATTDDATILFVAFISGSLFPEDAGISRHDTLDAGRKRHCTSSAMQDALTAMAHTASHPQCASAVLARNAPTALPPQMCAPKTVLKRLRASGATEVISVWFATRAERSPQSRSTAPAITAPTHKGANANATYAASTRHTPPVTMGKAPRRSVQRPAACDTSMPAAPGIARR